MPGKTQYKKYVPKKKTPRYSRFTKSRMSQRYGYKSESTPEVKFIDTTVNVNPVATGTVTLVNGLALGTDYNNRIGRKIEMTSVEYDFIWAANTADLNTGAVYPESSDIVRVSLVYDKQPNGAAPTWSDIYELTSVIAPMSHRNVNNLDRFIILATDLLNISVAGPNAVSHHRYLKTKHDVRFNASNAGTIADIQSGALFLVSADQNTVGTNQGNLQGRVRVRFHDF